MRSSYVRLRAKISTYSSSIQILNHVQFRYRMIKEEVVDIYLGSLTTKQLSKNILHPRSSRIA